MIIGIVGLGVIGGSLGRVMTLKGHTVYGTDRNPSVVKKAILLRAAEKELDEENAAELDMLIVAVYPRDFKDIAERFIPHMKKGAILSDICGNKRIVIEAMEELYEKFPEIKYIGTHPMAGKEYNGIERSSVRLFDGASIILVPLHPDMETLTKIKEFYLSLGFNKVVLTDADNHDGMIAYTSQLCHIVSNAFIKSDSAIKHAGYSAGSYLDLTRVARLEPSMWSQLMIDNKDKLLAELTNLISNLQRYEEALKEGDEAELKRLLSEGNELKKRIDKR